MCILSDLTISNIQMQQEQRKKNGCEQNKN